MPEPNEEQAWGDDVRDRVTRRVNEIMAGDAETEEAEETEVEGDESETEEQPAATPRSQASKGAKSDRKQPAGEDAPETEELEPTFEVDGKVYTLTEVREMRDGNMRQSDYSQKTMALARDREAHAREQQDRKDLNALITRQNDLIDRLVRGGTIERPGQGEEVDPETGLPMGAARDVHPKTVETMAKLQDEIKELRDGIESREKAREQERFDDYLVSHADREVDRLFRVFKVPAALQPLYRNSIFGADPNVRDGQGQITPQSIAAAIKREFTRIHGPASKHIQTESRATVDGLRRETPRVPKRSTRPANEKPSERPKAKPWDSEKNADDFIERVAEIAGEGRGED